MYNNNKSKKHTEILWADDNVAERTLIEQALKEKGINNKFLKTNTTKKKQRLIGSKSVT